MTPPKQPVFLERGVYRRRRVVDAVKLLPMLGVAVFLLPVLLLDDTQAEQNSTASRLVFFFCAWASLICIAFVLSRWLRPSEDVPNEAEGRGQ